MPYAAQMPADWVFLMPDTCEVDSDFKAKTEAWAQWEYDLVGLWRGYMRCFIGLYHHTYLTENLRQLKRCQGMSKREMILFETDGAMLSWAKMYRHATGSLQEWDRQEDVYGVGRPRWHRYFGAFGLTKWTVARKLEEVNESRARML